MEISKLTELLQKKYPEFFSKDLISLYPYMIKCYGQEVIDKFLQEWKYVIVDNPGASGAVYREKKEITVNEYNKKLFWFYRIITATFHEVGHALGTLKFNTDTFLSDGDDLDDFFSKMDEAVVSDYQDDLLYGQLQYDYTNSYNFKCRGDAQHIQNYAVQKLYYNIFKIILGEQKNLIFKMMYEKDLNKKQEIFNEIVMIINEKLNPYQFKCLMDSCAVLVYNHGYSMIDSNKKYLERRKNRREMLYKSNYGMVSSGQVSLEEYNIEFKKWFKTIYDDKYKRVVEYVNNNGIANIGIMEQCDHLCEMTVDYLTEQLEKMDNFDFDLIKSICIYFSKINNKSEVFAEKTTKLRELLYQHLSRIEFKLCQEITDNFSDKEIINIIIKLFSINNISLDALNGFKIMRDNNDNQEFLYASDGNIIIKIGRYSDLIKDDLKEYHDLSSCNIYVDTVIKKIDLFYGNSIGDSNVNENLKNTGKPLCELIIKEKNKKRF